MSTLLKCKSSSSESNIKEREPRKTSQNAALCSNTEGNLEGWPLWGDKVSMLTHIYPHKPWRNIEVTMQNHQADSPLYVWPDV